MQRFLIGIALAVVASTIALTQQLPTFRTEANYVRVDVYPTRDGVPVADLQRGDFEVLEDRVPQRIEQFERIVVRGGGPQETRREPGSVAAAREAAEDPRARVFVVFLDVNHVEVAGSHNIRKPLTEALDRMIGPDDLVAVMTPEMPASGITFARKTTTIDGILSRYWNWGERDRLNSKDPREDQYRACYPGTMDDTGIAQAMIDRRREKMTLDALQDLVRYLRGVREERKAILAITDGWRLYRPDPGLARELRREGPPSGPDVLVDPRTGRLTTKDGRNPSGTSPQDCDNDRVVLAHIDDEQEFRDMLDEANRANASFYPVDPRGLVVFDTPIVSSDSTGTTAAPMGSPAADRRLLLARLESMRTLAEATDGLAILDSNSLAAGMQRVVADLSSYYLLGYYSSAKLDGKFHSITVRVTRPGVEVRARRGYLAATAAEAAKTAAAAPASAAPPTSATLLASAVSAAVDRLAASSRDQPLRIAAAAGWTPAADAPAAAVWTAVEIADRLAGADVDAMLLPVGGDSVASARGRIEPGTTGALLRLAGSTPLVPGEYTLHVRVQSTATGAATATSSVTVAASPQPSGAILVRRGQSTGNREVPTADPRFRRGDRLRVDVPTTSADAATARLLDRTGNPLPIPVAVTARTDPDGSRWHSASLSLAPLAAGDYVVEMAGGSGGSGMAGTERTLIAFRVIP